MVLSHGHYDHFGGMVGFLAASQGKRKPKLPLYIGEECFCSRQFTAGPTPLNFGALDRKAIAGADLSVTTAEGPALIADHVFTTGHIPRATFERVLSPTRMKVGIENGLGCFPDKMPPNRRPDSAQQSRHPGDRSGQARCDGIEPWPLRSLRRHGWIPRGKPGKAQAEAAALYWRRGMLLFTSVHCRADATQFRRTRSQSDRGGGSVRHNGRRTRTDRRSCLHHRPHTAGDVRTGAVANPHESRNRERPRLLPRQDAAESSPRLCSTISTSWGSIRPSSMRWY